MFWPSDRRAVFPALTGQAVLQCMKEIQIYRYKENRIQNSPQISDLRGIHILWHRQEGKEYDHKFEQ